MTKRTMTREEYRSLGGDDLDLARAYRELTDIEIDICGEDSERTQEVRRVAFDRVTTAAMLEGKVMPMRGQPISSLAIDSPAAHREAMRSPGRNSGEGL
jgi:hypothetical protein